MAEAFVARVEPENNHVCLRVKDFGSALHFYHDLIGLPILRTMGDPADPTFIWLPGLQLARQTEDPGPNPYGIFDHVGIAVENIEEICARLDAAGCPIDTPIGQRDLPGIARKVVTAFYRDPDGNRVELVHWL